MLDESLFINAENRAVAVCLPPPRRHGNATAVAELSNAVDTDTHRETPEASRRRLTCRCRRFATFFEE